VPKHLSTYVFIGCSLSTKNKILTNTTRWFIPDTTNDRNAMRKYFDLQSIEFRSTHAHLRRLYLTPVHKPVHVCGGGSPNRVVPISKELLRARYIAGLNSDGSEKIPKLDTVPIEVKLLVKALGGEVRGNSIAAETWFGHWAYV